MIRRWEMTNCHFSRFIDKRGVRPSYKNLSIYVLCPHEERAWYKSDPFPSRTTFQEFLIIALPWLSIQLNWPVKTDISYLTVKHTLFSLSWKLLKTFVFVSVRPSVSPVLWGPNHDPKRWVFWNFRLFHHFLWGGPPRQWKCQEEEGGRGENCQTAPRGEQENH